MASESDNFSDSHAFEPGYRQDPFSDAWVPDPNYVPPAPHKRGKSKNRARGRGEYRRFPKPVLYAAALVTAAAVGGGSLLAISRGGGSSADQQPRHLAGASAHPGKVNKPPKQSVNPNAMPTTAVTNGVIDYGKAVKAVTGKPLPPAVVRDERSLVTITGAGRVHKTADGEYVAKTGYDGTGFVIGPDEVYTAGHVAVGDDAKDKVEPRFTIVTADVNGKNVGAPITSLQIPAHFNAGSNRYDDRGYPDAAIMRVDPKNSTGTILAPNGIDTVPAIQQTYSLPTPGEIVDTMGLSTPSGMKNPTQTPNVSEAIYIGRSGDQAVLLPLNNETGDGKYLGINSGDSGGPDVIPQTGVEFANNSAGGENGEAYMSTNELHLEYGGPRIEDAPINKKLVGGFVPVEYVTLNDPALQQAPVQHLQDPMYKG